VGGGNTAGEALRGEHVSRSVSEPVSASLRNQEWPVNPSRGSLGSAMKQRAEAVAGLFGVGGGSARGKIS